MRVNLELLVEVKAASTQEAEAIGDRLALDMEEQYKLPLYGKGGVGYGRVVSVSCEAAAEKRV